MTTSNENLLETLGYFEHQVDQLHKEKSEYFDKILILKEQRDFLMEMLKWIIEAHGNSETTEYTGDESPWKLKDYIEERLKGDYQKIDFNKYKETNISK